MSSRQVENEKDRSPSIPPSTYQQDFLEDEIKELAVTAISLFIPVPAGWPSDRWKELVEKAVKDSLNVLRRAGNLQSHHFSSAIMAIRDMAIYWDPREFVHSDWEDPVAGLVHERDEAISECRAFQADRDRLRKALRWYEEKVRAAASALGQAMDL